MNLPWTPTQIRGALQALGIEEGQHLMVRASLNAATLHAFAKDWLE